MKRQAMREAWGLISRDHYTKSDALRQGWLLAKTRRAMTEHKTVTFEFLKADGKTIRRAFGTLHPLVIPPVQGTRTPPPSTQVYFDMEKHEWRSFRKTNLLRLLL